jgi:arsenate reductase
MQAMASHPMAVSVLRELGIDHKGASKSVDEFRDHAFDVVVTVCDDASEACPVWLGTGIRKHHSFRDPARAEGTEQERRELFRLIRDEIVAALPALLD